MTQHSALRGFSTRHTPQSQPIPGSDQVPNSAGGYAWEADRWQRFHRFLILGTEGGTYYIGEQDLTQENATVILECIAEDGIRTVNQIVAISKAGRAPKNDPAIFALAMCAKLGDLETRRAAYEALPHVCRIGTHLFHFATYVEQFGGWGRGLRRAVAGWYGRDVDQIAYQAVKYRQRDGWSHRDLLRLSHPKSNSEAHDRLFHWIVSEPNVTAAEREQTVLNEDLPVIVQGYDAAMQAEKPDETAELIRGYELPREAVKPEHLTSPEVWEALLEKMPMTAMIRNLATMTRVGLLAPLSEASKRISERLQDPDELRKARIHPIAILAALTTYSSGSGARGRGEWEPVSEIVDALNDAFYFAFGNVEPTGKRTMLALDVSGSMDWGSVAGIPGLSPRVAAAAMSLVTKAVEPSCFVTAFATEIIPLPLSERERLDDVILRTSQIPFGGTDCALPMLYAEENGIEVDTFVIYTDSETWAGTPHPVQALRAYRDKSGLAARFVVVAMEGNSFSIADPNDPGMLDVVGFDTATPNLIADFSAGRL